MIFLFEINIYESRFSFCVKQKVFQLAHSPTNVTALENVFRLYIIIHLQLFAIKSFKEQNRFLCTIGTTASNSAGSNLGCIRTLSKKIVI